MGIKNVLAELDEAPEGSFLRLLEFNEGGVGACSITGTSPVWEMHPDTDEFFHVIEGALEFEMLLEEKSEHWRVEAGSVCVIPRGVWHRPAAPTGARFLFMTPGQSLHSDARDPRVAGAQSES